MGGGSMGPLVPVKSENPSPFPPETSVRPLAWPPEAEEEEEAALDRDILCPICMQIIKDAFLTACGHSFCYMCIITHLRNKNDCPCCARYLTTSHVFPNFLLDKLLKKNCARQIWKSGSPVERLRRALEEGCKASAKELAGLLSLITEKKRKAEQEEVEKNTQILLDFLHSLRRQKLEELNEIQTNLQYIKDDINAVERHRTELIRAKQTCFLTQRMLDDPVGATPWPSLIDQNTNGVISRTCNLQSWKDSAESQNKQTDVKTQLGFHTRDAESRLNVSRKRQIDAQFMDLQECYLQKRKLWVRQSDKHEDRDTNTREGYSPGLEDFRSVLASFTRYSQFRVIAELSHGDLFHSANVVSSIEFDRDDELFATAGVSKRIKVFEFSSVVNEPADVHCPLVEMSTRSKLSCLSWSKYTKNHIASSDYDGIVTVWDVTTRQSVMEYEEHEKRAWSVDFSSTDPSMLVSGSDDCKVKVWCMKQEASVLNIDMKANICSVKYNPGSTTYLAIGSADHHVHYYDLRSIREPVSVFSGHRKAVSYVKFLSNNELASASTDSTLRLWDVKEYLPLKTFRGHRNEKNFVGLSVNREYMACGSETNEVFVYHKAVSKPAARHRFGSETDEADDVVGSNFISAVCWKSDSPTMLTANSQGTIKALVLAA